MSRLAVRLLVILLTVGSPTLASVQAERLEKGSGQKKLNRALQQEERQDYYDKWLNQDVVHIISPEERAVFERLTTAEEKEAFIEQFWIRRDPNPRTAVNEFKEEHYRRIAYANDHFTSGVDGWSTDRGRIYIKFGPPTAVEKHPTGQVYDRPIREAGGTTVTYPYEVWYYHHIEGVGTGIEIQFVDRTGTGRYELAMREDDKDALLFVSSAGETLFELMGLENRLVRIRRSDAMRPLGLGDELPNPGANPFDRLKRHYDLERASPVRFKDLQALVDAQIHYQNLPFVYRGDLFRISPERSQFTLTIGLDLKDVNVTPTSADGVRRVQANFYARVQTLGRRIEYEFDDVLYSDLSGGANLSEGLLLYQYAIPLSPGRYKLSMVLKEDQSDKMGTTETLIVVPESSGSRLATSSLVLAEYIGPAAGDEFPGPFLTAGGLKIYPNMGGVFSPSSPLGLYAEIYNLQVEQSTLRPSLDVSCEILNSAGQTIYREDLTSSATAIYNDRATVAKIWPNVGLSAGKYILRLSVTDQISGQNLQQDTRFEVVSSQ